MRVHEYEASCGQKTKVTGMMRAHNSEASYWQTSVTGMKWLDKVQHMGGER